MEIKNDSEEGKCMACKAGGGMKGCMGSCGCGCCHGGKMRLIFLLRVLVMIIILMVVFLCGFKLGSLRTSFNREYRGYPMMLQGGYGNASSGQAGGMVQYRMWRGTSTVQ